MLLFFILLLIVPCLTIKKRTNDDGVVFDAKSTTCLKGIICLFVMFHNLGLDYPGNSEIMELICEHAGGVGVGLFFFLSAFGIIRSYQKKGNKYILKLIFVHSAKIYLIAVFVNLLTYLLFLQGSYEPTDAVLRILNLDLLNGFKRINRHGWYIATIILMYLIFGLIYYLCSKLKTKNKWIIAGVTLSIVSVGLRIAAIIADTGGMYTREITAFSTGVLYATFYNQINAFFNKYFKLSLVVSFVAMWIGFFLFEPLSTHAAAIFLIVISQKISYYHPVSFFLGKICIGVYLFLHLSSIILQPYLNNPYWWMLLNAGFILELSVLLYGVQIIISKVINLIKEKIKKKEGDLIA